MYNTIKSINNKYNIDSNSINFNTLNNTDKNKQKKYIEVKNIYQFEILESKLYTIIYNINKINIILYSEFSKLLKYIVNSFHILLHNSSLCNFNKNKNSIIYKISDYSIIETYSIIKSYSKNNNRDLYLFIDNIIDINKIEFKNYNNFLKDLSYNNNDNNQKDKIINTVNEFINVIHLFDVSDKINEFYNPIYINFINLYTIAQTTLQTACNNSLHNIDNNVKTLIFDELKNARLLYHQIKDKIEELNLSTPNLTNHIEQYVTSCKSIIDVHTQ